MTRPIVPPLSLRSPHVVITGASSGLGAALAAHYAARGCRLSLMGRNVDRLRAVQSRARSIREDCQVGIFCIDVRDDKGMHETLTGIDDARPVTLLIANAGIGGAAALSGPAGELPETARNLISTNVLGVINSIGPLLPRLTARRHGHIVIVGSIAGHTALPEAPSYSASKAAAQVYGTALRRSLSSSGVGVTVVSPGFIETPMSASLPMAKPFLEPVERAAARIARAVDKGRRELSFPWQLAWIARLDGWLPVGIGDRVSTAVTSRKSKG